MLRTDNSEMQDVSAGCAFAFDTGHTAAEVLRTEKHERHDAAKSHECRATYLSSEVLANS